MKRRYTLKTIPANQTRIEAAYRLSGKTHTIEDSPSNVRDQLTTLQTIYPDLKFLGWR